MGEQASTLVSATACCRKCYYALAGVAARRCPECGREFDPADPKSFLARPPSKWRWPRRIATVLLLVGAVYAFAPTGYVRATLRLTGPGNRGELITRYSLLPPLWLGDVPYPFWSFHEHHDDEHLAATQAPEDVTALNYLIFTPAETQDGYVGLSAEFVEWSGANRSQLGVFRVTSAQTYLSVDGLVCTHDNAGRVLARVSRRAMRQVWGGVETVLVPHE